MKEKKQASDWWIATTHWLTSFFVPTALIGILFFAISYIVIQIFGSSEEFIISAAPYMATVNALLIVLIIGWIGPMYGARYLNKKYIIPDNKIIAKNATIIIALLGGGYRVYEILSSGLMYEHIGFFIAIILFYFSSKKYIMRTEVTSAPLQGNNPQGNPPVTR